jgi:hypothetical protein
MARIEHAGTGIAHVETRDVARHLRAMGCPRDISLRVQASREIDEELGSLDVETRCKMIEHRAAILGEQR